jgi:L-ascorbate metabolism protein UlaG (beta-lactamase superfamily)
MMPVNNLENFITNQLVWLGQSGFKARSSSGQFLYIDPFKVPKRTEPADLILITHPHHDHFNPAAIDLIKQKDMVIITPGSMEQSGMMGLAAGKTVQIGPFKVTGIPAYNLKKSFHAKDSHWLGYVVEVDGVRLYHAGDTDFIPEMEGLQPDIALLPVGGTFGMDVDEAVQAAEAIKPKVVIPMHYGFLLGGRGAGKKFAKAWSGETKVLKV